MNHDLIAFFLAAVVTIIALAAAVLPLWKIVRDDMTIKALDDAATNAIAEQDASLCCGTRTIYGQEGRFTLEPAPLQIATENLDEELDRKLAALS